LACTLPFVYLGLFLAIRRERDRPDTPDMTLQGRIVSIENGMRRLATITIDDCSTEHRVYFPNCGGSFRLVSRWFHTSFFSDGKESLKTDLLGSEVRYSTSTFHHAFIGGTTYRLAVLDGALAGRELTAKP
jgi:hypothetical protein